MLTFAEEIYLLSLDDTSGKIVLSGGQATLHRAMVGAILCELAFLNRVDVDLDYLYVVDSSATGMPLLDDVLDWIISHHQRETPHYWLERLLPEAAGIEDAVAEALVEKGILKLEESRFLWVFPSRRYPLIDDEEVKDVESRLREIVLTDTIPSPRDTVLLSLTYACDLLHEICSPRELQRCHDRIENLVKLDLLCMEIIREINELPIVANMPPQAF